MWPEREETQGAATKPKPKHCHSNWKDEKKDQKSRDDQKTEERKKNISEDGRQLQKEGIVVNDYMKTKNTEILINEKQAVKWKQRTKKDWE